MIYYTTIEQAEHLVELGLDPETADMCWTNHCYGQIRSSMRVSSKTVKEYKELLTRFADKTSIDVFIPCWSLGALSNVIYKFVIHEYGLKGWVGMYVCSISEFTTYYANDADVVHEEKGETFLEAVYKMVCYLLENSYIKKHKS